MRIDQFLLLNGKEMHSIFMELNLESTGFLLLDVELKIGERT